MHDHSIEYRTLSLYDGYRFGADGSVWSCWKQTHSHVPGKGYIKTDEWRIVRPSMAKKGRKYQHVTPRRSDGLHGRNVPVHHLILLAFHGERPRGMVARHLDDNKFNNAADNLAWGTHSDNANDAVRNGRRAVGERVHTAKLTTQDVASIRQKLAAGRTQRALAKEYGVAHATIGSILRGQSWTHLQANVVG